MCLLQLYDDSFPLANLHSAPLNSSGDDFSSVPTMPKRPPRTSAGVASAGGANGNKAGTLGPYGKGSRRSAAPGPGHHTLGPGGQLYDADVASGREAGRDSLRRGTRTTGRTRRTRHGRHHQEVYSNCPQDDVDLDGLADEFTVFKQYNNTSTGSSESADNYDVPMLVSAPPASESNNKRHHRKRERDSGNHHGVSSHHRKQGGRHLGGLPVAADSLSPASDLSDCDRLSSNRSSYDETASNNAASRGHGGHANPLAGHHHHPHRKQAKQSSLLYDASEDDVTPDSAVVADISASPRAGGGPGLHSPRDKRPAGLKRAGRRHQHHISQESPSSPELHDNVWSPQ